MSGHSHWSGIKHHKGINDAKRAAIFTKYGRNIIVAASHGGGNPDTNFALRLAIDQARTVNMPKENIERAIKRGTGESKDGAVIEEILYEGYGPGNVALLIKTATDNRNRTVSEVKNILVKGGGKFALSGSVTFMFRHVGIIAFSLERYPQETLEMETLDSGADDFLVEDDVFLVITQPGNLQSVRVYFTEKNILPESAELGYLPAQTIALEETDGAALEKLRETLDDHPDVQRVWDNLQ
jgi:YebC/PmpR family DNA-binding regulatory protein